MHPDHLIKSAEQELRELDARRSELLARIAELKQTQAASNHSPPSTDACSGNNINDNLVTGKSPTQSKITLFRSLFHGREDIFPRRFESVKTGKSGYQPACRNEWVKGVCRKPAIKCNECTSRVFIPLSDEIIRSHLKGHNPADHYKKNFTIGVYPLLPDSTCRFLAVDFDKSSWREDAVAFLEKCRSMDIPAVLERSRSGSGGHIWIFFNEPVPAVTARRMGSFLLTEVMEERPEIGFDSYDRLFPSQDTIPNENNGFGNLIALPFQKHPAEKGNSLFIDDAMQPYNDQWQFLSAVKKMERVNVEAIANDAARKGRIIAVRMAVTDEDDDKPWTVPPSGKSEDKKITGPLPDHLQLVLGDQLYIPKENLSPQLRNRLIRIPAFQNPEFYRAQAMRMSTFGKPRIISCCEDHRHHFALPRGSLEEVTEFLDTTRINHTLQDERFGGTPVQCVFHGELRPEQTLAANALLNHDTGVLSAGTAFGKTVIAAFIIAQRGVNTLILVNRTQLLHQWMERLRTFLELPKNSIGQIGSGKKRPSGIIDVALIQSLCRKGTVADIVANYGQMIVDECHHITAPTFELVAKKCKGRYFLGLSATVTRKDGHHPIIFMQLGPLRYRVTDKEQATARPFTHEVIPRLTDFQIRHTTDEHPQIQQIYTEMCDDNNRNVLITSDVCNAVEHGRSPLILTERRSHVEQLSTMLTAQGCRVFILQGGTGRKKNALLMKELSERKENDRAVIVATGRFIGEGFDDARLDTLFLAHPVSWRGTLAQYAGRLHRMHYAKKQVMIYDYVDINVPVLARMFERRKPGYRSIGYELKASNPG
jgi:superfamily II DNA or RNA helicase